MVAYITLEDAEVQFEELIAKVELGETVVLTRDGKPAVELRPHRPTLASGEPPPAKGNL